MAAAGPLGAQVTGLADWDIFLDPGHSQQQNMGIYGYSEAEKSLRVAFELRDLLLTTTDIDTVYLSRTNDTQEVGLTQRTDLANGVAASWYHSLHSNAGSPTANNVLFLWAQLYNGDEPAGKPGGKAMSDVMIEYLAGGMRIPSSGSIGDCDFYGGCSASSPGPWLHVNRNSTMPSELSEAGFHTHPVQNPRNMSVQWKRLEAYTFLWSILQFHGLTRPAVAIITGTISDLESGVALNGAVATAGGMSDTTDTFESLFNRYSSDPGQLRNGFYFLEGVSGPIAELVVSAPNYDPATLQVSLLDSFFTFRDVGLVSSLPPYLVSSTPAAGDTSFPAWDPLDLVFSRPMDPISVAAAFTAPGGVTGAIVWTDGNRRMTFTPDATLATLTDYSLTIAASAQDAFGHAIDGNGDGVGGDALTLAFRTGPADLSPPQPVAVYPADLGTGVELRPIISVAFDEVLDVASVGARAIGLVRSGYSPYNVPGELRHYVVGDRSVLNYFTAEQLTVNRRHTTWVFGGLRDLLGNVTTTRSYRFDTGELAFDATSIDDFEAGLEHWWEPLSSGTTTAGNVIADSTFRLANHSILNLMTGSSTSLELHYGWDTGATAWLLREFLGGGAPRAVTFDDSYSLQAYVFGDGSGNLFRFAVDDNNLTGAVADHEVSHWTTIDWIGWRLVVWDLANDGTGTWLGDGKLDGSMRFDSFQLSHVPGAVAAGTIYIDDLRLVQTRLLAVAEEGRQLPRSFVLHPNYPNPFNPATTLVYDLPRASPVRLTIYNLRGQPVRELVKGMVAAGRHQAVWDGTDGGGQPVASGVYIVRLQAGSANSSRKLILSK
ncbi:MAG: Ig-like domain-containing protein [Candidatus Marinimicrobia bacterium]|nr:Ig-like domain-containing protein [Candidatus Neomarinimicrobiota bacterium]